MKLITLTNRYYFLAFAIAFSVVAISSYYIIKHVIDKEFNEKLHAEKQQFIDEFDTYDKLNEVLYLNIGDIITVEEQIAHTTFNENISDTTMFDAYEKKMLDFRRLEFSASHKGKSYRVVIFKSLVNNNDLLEALAEIMLLVALLFMLSLIVINIIIAKRIWQPFYETLSKLQFFDIKNPEPLHLTNPKVFEFSQLNQTVRQMAQQNVSAYQNLKEYTENASHEIQTPLAIIQNKSELLLQNGGDEKLLANIVQIKSAANRLSKLKEGLAILSRIENNQYADQKTINLKDYIKELLENVDDLIEIKKIHLTIEEESSKSPVLLQINETLAYFLFNNLISNAIKYNLDENGFIKIVITKSYFLISNSGMPISLESNELFGRFKRSGESKDSTGLGLSIVKKISDLYQMEIEHQYDEGIHAMMMKWN